MRSLSWIIQANLEHELRERRIRKREGIIREKKIECDCSVCRNMKRGFTIEKIHSLHRGY